MINKTNGIFLLITSVLMLIISLISGSCSTAGKSNDEGFTAWNSAGWVDDNTYRIRVFGAPHPNLKNADLKKQSSKEMALLKAQSILNEKFSYDSDAAFRERGEEEYDPYAGKRAQRLKEIIISGSIVAERYDAEQNCEIIYDISASGLKTLCIDVHGKLEQ